MVTTDARVNVSVSDRILAHLWEQDHQADHYLVTFEMTRPGIAEVCALHLPNVCLLYTSPSPRDGLLSRMPSSA